MRSIYLKRIPYELAVARQEQNLLARQNEVIGFESEPVVTLGRRSAPEDLLVAPADRGFATLAVDRGGQATVHNPGQLVIFPVVAIQAIGVRAWILLLVAVTQTCLREWGIESEWNEAKPGLYTARGKIMSCGIRVRAGMSTHGIAINVNNDLSDFAWIRTCGQRGAALDRVGQTADPQQVFVRWVENFQRQFQIKMNAASPQLTR